MKMEKRRKGKKRENARWGFEASLSCSRPHLLKVYRLPVAPQATSQAFNTQAFGKHSRVDSKRFVYRGEHKGGTNISSGLNVRFP